MRFSPAVLGPIRRLPAAALGLVAVCSLATAGSNPRIYVDSDATGSADGQSWSTAYTSLQDGLADARGQIASGLVEIWVAEGLYRPDVGTGLADDDRTLAFVLDENMRLYGGFSGTEATLNERSWTDHPTVLSGDIDENDTVDADGVTTDTDSITGSNSIHVVRGRGLTGNTLVDGFIVTGGLANGDGSVEFDSVHRDDRGAGVNIINSYPALRNLRIQGNMANTASGAGGGMWLYDFPGPDYPAVQVENFEVVHNRAWVAGGIGISRGAVAFDGCRIANNQAYAGGGMYIDFNDGSFHNCIVEGNQSEFHAGGVAVFRAEQVWVNSRITGNYTEGDGGGLYIQGISIVNRPIVITNTVISGNRAGTGGGIFRTPSDSGESRLYNTIVWNNQDSTGAGTASANHGGPGGARLFPEHSLIQAFAPGGDGNLDGTVAANAPQFLASIDPASAPTVGGDFRLSATSPLIEQGDNAARINSMTDPVGPTPPDIPLEGNIFEDLAGETRIVDADGSGGAVVDLGPHEFQVDTYAVGGTVSGLTSGGLVLQNNGADDLPISSNGDFSFPAQLSDGADYEVTVLQQPDGSLERCQVNNGQGTISGADVDDVEVACTLLPPEIFDDRFEP